jgi:hypothetical protein
VVQRYAGRVDIDDKVPARVVINDIARPKWVATELEAEEPIWVVSVGGLRLRVRLLDGECAGKTAVAGFEGLEWHAGKVRRALSRLRRAVSRRKYPLLRGETAFS